MPSFILYNYFLRDAFIFYNYPSHVRKSALKLVNDQFNLSTANRSNAFEMGGIYDFALPEAAVPVIT